MVQGEEIPRPATDSIKESLIQDARKGQRSQLGLRGSITSGSTHQPGVHRVHGHFLCACHVPRRRTDDQGHRGQELRRGLVEDGLHVVARVEPDVAPLHRTDIQGHTHPHTDTQSHHIRTHTHTHTYKHIHTYTHSYADNSKLALCSSHVLVRPHANRRPPIQQIRCPYAQANARIYRTRPQTHGLTHMYAAFCAQDMIALPGIQACAAHLSKGEARRHVTLLAQRGHRRLERRKPGCSPEQV